MDVKEEIKTHDVKREPKEETSTERAVGQGWADSALEHQCQRFRV